MYIFDKIEMFTYIILELHVQVIKVGFNIQMYYDFTILCFFGMFGF